MNSVRMGAQASGLTIGRRLSGIAGLVAVIALSSGCVASSSSEGPTSGAAPGTSAVESSTPAPSTPPSTQREVDPPSSDLEDSTDRDLTRSQSEAIESARSYLDFSAFSRSGLIDQLEFEGFSNDDATFAVDSLNVDWNEQAAKSAESYLEYSSFSRSGLIEQLEYEGFTSSQAEYGVDVAYGGSEGGSGGSSGGSVSRQNAVDSARSYLDYSAFSRSGLIDQLEFEGFSNDDATFAVDSLNVDWNEQAAKSAESYLEYSSFSRSGLIDQLIFEGFTQSQAEYGVSRTGL